MPFIRAAGTGLMSVPADVVYGVLADYRHGHPQTLPERWLSDLEVERGGVGTGTVIRFRMRWLGRTREYRAEVKEPEPGRVLAERNLDAQGAVTTFTVQPVGEGVCRVTIATEWTRPGLAGVFERLVAPRLLRRVYHEQLRRLAAVAGRRLVAADLSG